MRLDEFVCDREGIVAQEAPALRVNEVAPPRCVCGNLKPSNNPDQSDMRPDYLVAGSLGPVIQLIHSAPYWWAVPLIRLDLRTGTAAKEEIAMRSFNPVFGIGALARPADPISNSDNN